MAQCVVGTKRNGWYFQLLQAVAKTYKFDVNTPLEGLTAKSTRCVVFSAVAIENISFTYYSDKGQYERNHPF